MSHFTLYPIGGDNYLLVALAAAVLLALLFVGPVRDARLNPRRRQLLIAIRLAVILLVIAAMLRPTLVYTKTTRQPATLVILVDRSRSMTVPDEVDGRTRWEAQLRALDDAREALVNLDKDFEIKAYAFDATAEPVKVTAGQLKLDEKPEGRQTAIGSVLDDVLQQEAGKRLLGVLLLSDGAQRAYPPRDTLPQVSASRLRPLGFPLYAFRFGKSQGLGQARDIAVKDLADAQRVFVRNQLPISGQLRVDGYVNRPLSVRLLFETSPGKMEVVDQKNVSATSDGQIIPIDFSYVPETTGEFKVTLEAVAQPGELVATNNQLSTFVDVLAGGLNVLYLEGAYRQEIGYLRRALDASPDIDVDYFFINPRHKETKPADLPQRFEPGKYTVYVLGDIDSSVFTQEELAALAEAVNRGAGLIMLGGYHSFGPGGYAGTPLADLLPVEMQSNERQPLDGQERGDRHWQGELKMRPSPQGAGHFAMMLAGNSQENQSAWAQLPALEGANRFHAIKPAGVVLAEAGPNRPLLVSQTYGAGRVLAFAGDSTWRWQMQGFEEAHKRFWRQIILWLARKDESLEGTVWIRLRQRRFSPGQRVEFTAGAQDAQNQPVKDADFTAEVVRPDGSTEPLPLVQGQEQMAGSYLETLAPGDYTVRVTATRGQTALGTAKTRFLVSDQDLELDNAAADATVLDNLAETTGGKSMAPEELPGLIERLSQQTEMLEIQTETKKTLWDTWPFFFTFVALLSVEWFLRKRWGLV